MIKLIMRTLELTKQLMSCPSITPQDAGCQDILSKELALLGFEIKHLDFSDVKNFWARRGTQAPLLVFAGHTDVVPTGPLAQWTFPPFTPSIKNGYLYGRGAVDMKSSLAAMIIACEQFISEYPDYPGSLGFLITSDEEGLAINGTKKVVEYLITKGEKIDACLVGEPSSSKQVGDVIKIGRRGSLNGKLIIYGQQGHIAYASSNNNPIYPASLILAELYNTPWEALPPSDLSGHHPPQGGEGSPVFSLPQREEGNLGQYFPATCFQASNITSGTGATNIIPGELELTFNFRYSPLLTPKQLKNQVKNIVNKYSQNYHLEWGTPAQPFYTPAGRLVKSCQAAVNTITGLTPELSTSGGTSDGRFIAPAGHKAGCEVAELGLCNATIHEIDERVLIEDLEKLTRIYKELLIQFFIIKK